MNFDWDDILIIGDSYCEHRTDTTDWPLVLSNLLSNSSKPPRGIGGGGCSWWFARKMLLREISIKVPKVLILCHTSSERIPNDHNYGINWAVVLGLGVGKNMFTDKSVDEKQVINAAREYYKYLYSIDYNKWAVENWYNELDNYLKKIDIPYVIHLNCFHDHTFNYGTTSEQLLISSSQKFDGTMYYKNHFTEEQNVQLGNNLYKAILNYNVNDRLKNLELFR